MQNAWLQYTIGQYIGVGFPVDMKALEQLVGRTVEALLSVVLECGVVRPV